MQANPKNERCFEELIEQAPVVFEFYNGNGLLVHVNSAFERLWQLEIESEPGAGTTAALIVPLDRLT